MPTAREKNQPKGRRLGPGVRVRRAMPRDFELLVRHRQAMWRDIGTFTREEVAESAPPYREWVRSEMREKRFLGFVAEDGRGRVLGSGGLWFRPEQPRPGRLAGKCLPYILSMYTEPRFRRSGVATRLVMEMVRWCRANGFHSRVTLHASRAGRPVYARAGFKPGNEMTYDLVE